MSRKSSLLVLIIISLLSGCVTAGSIEEASTLSPDKPAVFGKVQVFIQNVPHQWNRNFTGPTNFWLLVKPAGSQEASSYRLDDTPEFHWSLAPGKYNLVGYVLRHFANATIRRTWAEFTVPANVSAAYVGDISISLVEDTSAINVSDNFNPAAAAFRTRFPDLKAPPVKALMRFPEGGGSNTRAEPPCGSVWGVQCQNDFIGVGPVNAAIAGVSWMPSTNSGVTYDLVVYEMVRFMYCGLFGPVKMPGHRVVYRENISGNSFVFDQALNPNATYYWSVRLRKGDRVTNWSRHKISSSLVIAKWTRTNPWFSFGAQAGRFR